MLKTITCVLVANYVLLASPAWGCPYCESDVGKEVAAGIFNADFGTNAALTLLPIPILVWIVYWIHFGFPWPKSAKPAKGSNPAQNTASVTFDITSEP